MLCAPPGGECCGSTACKAGFDCCSGSKIRARDLSSSLKSHLNSEIKLSKRADETCTIEGGTCCGDFTCDVGEKCCPDADGKPSHCGAKDSTCCGEGYCTKGKTCCGNGLGCADAGKKCCDGMRAACAVGEKCCLDPDDGVPYCGANNECLPTLTFPHFAGVTDEVGIHSFEPVSVANVVGVDV